MFICCAFFPLGLVFIVGPMFAAARSLRAFLITMVLDVLAIAIMLLTDLRGTMAALQNWRGTENMLLPLAGMLMLPTILGGLILYARHAESIDPGKRCRVCGYDLRATPERCPECGTLVKHNPDRF